MRVVALHADVIVATSDVWRTTCAAVRGSEDEAFLIDSPVLPSELETLPELLAQARFAVRGLIVTHADWDHLLGPLAFPEAALACGASTAARLAAEPGAVQREMRAFDEEHYLRRPALRLGGVQELPAPGKCEVGEHELEIHPAEGHTADGIAVLAPWAGVLCCGDYLSPVEVPMISPGGSLGAYRATLDRLRPLVERVDHVVPGHGGPLSRDRALAILAEDDSYLAALAERGAGAELPRGRRGAAQRRIHAENAERA